MNKLFVAEIGGPQCYWCQLFVNLGPPSEENDSPLKWIAFVYRLDILNWRLAVGQSQSANIKFGLWSASEAEKT